MDTEHTCESLIRAFEWFGGMLGEHGLPDHVPVPGLTPGVLKIQSLLQDALIQFKVRTILRNRPFSCSRSWQRLTSVRPMLPNSLRHR